MLIHSLDLGQRSGWAIGPAGTVPNSGFLLLRKKGESIAHAGYNLRCYLEMMWSKRRPDLIAYEAPMTLAAWIANAKRQGRMHNAEAHEHLLKLAHDIETLAYGLGLRCESVHRTSIMWGITGKQSWGSRDANKKAVINSLIRQKMLPVECVDDDRADAVAIHVIASGKFARCQNTNFGLFAGTQG